MNNLDLLLVNPCVNHEAERLRLSNMNMKEHIQRQQPPHIGMGYLLAVSKRDGIRTQYIDMAAYDVELDDLLKVVEVTEPKVVGLTAFTVQVKTAALVADAIKERFPDIPICLGGPHATAMPFESLAEFPSFDFMVCCEAEHLLLPMLNNLHDVRVVPGLVTSNSTQLLKHRIANLDELPFPAWEEFDLSTFAGSDPHRTQRELPIVTSRGCPFACNFCARMFGRNRLSRSVESVIAEMERNINEFGAEAFCFLDETFIANRKWNEELFTAMIEKGINKQIKWSCSTRVDIVTPDRFKLMRQSGCYCVFFGFEHGDDEMLKIMGKQVNAEQARRAVQWAKDAGIVVVGCFILGLPGETLESARRNMQFAKRLDIYSTSFPIATPFPGTLLREQALRHEYGLNILSNDWDDYGKQQPGVMNSDTLSIEQLTALQKEAYELNPKKNLDDYENPNRY